MLALDMCKTYKKSYIFMQKTTSNAERAPINFSWKLFSVFGRIEDNAKKIVKTCSSFMVNR